MAKAQARYWTVVAMNGRTNVNFMRVVTRDDLHTEVRRVNYKRLSASSIQRMNKFMQLYQSESTRAIFDEEGTGFLLGWSNLKHYNGVLMSSLDYMNKLAQELPATFHNVSV